MAVPHGEVSVEAMRLNEYGLSHEGAARAASISAYAYTGRSGALAPGNSADAVFFDRNPYHDVSVLSAPSLIIHRGRAIGS